MVDLRVLAMRAEHPEQVVAVNLDDPEQPAELLTQLVPTTVCALVADPREDRPLHYQMTLCLPARNRCDEDFQVGIGAGVIADPDHAAAGQIELCAPVMPNGNLLGLLLEAARDDAVVAIGGIDYQVMLTVSPESGPPEYATKTLRVSPKIPDHRTANRNPTVDRFEVTIGETDPVALPLGRCVDQVAPLVVAPDTHVRLFPVESEGARETYDVPTLDGKVATFTESLTYQWTASAGRFSSGSTGGTRDRAGNFPELFTHWTAPEDVSSPLDVQLWFVQRDERYGLTWYESCVRVE